MSNFIFPTSSSVDNAKRKYVYPSLLADLARGSDDSADALRLFRSLLRGEESSLHSVGFSAFDAHGGDTGCHLRAGMFLEAFATYRDMLENHPLAWQEFDAMLEQTIQKLETLGSSAKTACKKLTMEKLKPGKVGLHGNQEAPRSVLSKLGWSEEYTPIASSATSQSGDINVSTSSPSNNASTISLTQSKSTVASSASTLVQPQTSDSTVAWNILNFSTFTRFVVYSYVLSKYKRFAHEKSTIIGRMDITYAESVTSEAMKLHWDMAYSAYKNPGPTRIEKEFRELQCWLSELSTAWLLNTALKSSTQHDLSSLLSSTVQKSPKGLTAAACYPGYVVQRTQLADTNTPIILVDRHFCNDGYHVNVFTGRATKPKSSVHRKNTRVMKSLLRLFTQCFPSSKKIDEKSSEGAMVTGSTWEIQPSTLHDLMAGNNQSQPHLVVMGNSLKGSYDDYAALLASLPSEKERSKRTFPHQPSPKEKCPHNEQHVRQFLSADQDRVAQTTFAIHPAYPFPLPGNVNEIEHMQKCLESWEADHVTETEHTPGLFEEWQSLRGEADVLGSGAANMGCFKWQHVYLETPGRLGKMLQQSLEEADLMPLRAAV